MSLGGMDSAVSLGTSTHELQRAGKSGPEENMKELNWRSVFQEQMQEVKPKDVWSLGIDQQLDFNHRSPGWVRVLQEHVRARFTCSQCYHSWSSHQVVILLNLYWEPCKRQGWAWMRLYRQQCQECSSEKHEVPQFTETDVASVIHRLILDIQEKCYGENVDHSENSEVDREQDGPHQHQQCEACQMGVHYEKSEDADHHGWPQGAMPHGNTQSPTYSLLVSAENNQTITTAVPARSNSRPWSYRCIGAVLGIAMAGIWIASVVFTVFYVLKRWFSY